MPSPLVSHLVSQARLTRKSSQYLSLLNAHSLGLLIFPGRLVYSGLCSVVVNLGLSWGILSASTLLRCEPVRAPIAALEAFLEVFSRRGSRWCWSTWLGCLPDYKYVLLSGTVPGLCASSSLVIFPCRPCCLLFCAALFAVSFYAALWCSQFVIAR